jgi:hypothetical protein
MTGKEEGQTTGAPLAILPTSNIGAVMPCDLVTPPVADFSPMFR